MATKPYGVFGSLCRIIGEDARVPALLGRVYYSTRPTTGVIYPHLVVSGPGTGRPDYTFNGYKNKEYPVLLQGWAATSDQAEELALAVELVMEDSSKWPEIYVVTEAVPDAVEVEDAGGERYYEDTGRVMPNGKGSPWAFEWKWVVRVKRRVDTNRS